MKSTIIPVSYGYHRAASPRGALYTAEWRISETLQKIESKNFKFLNKGAVGAHDAHKLIMRKCSSPLGVNID